MTRIETPTNLAVRRRWSGLSVAVAVLAAGLLLVAPLFVYPVILMKVLCFALFASGYNILLGYAGLLSLGHAMFFGGAAYLCGYLVRNTGLSPELGLLAGTLAAALLGLVVGLIAIRRTGIYFAMVTLALAQMFYFLCLQVPATGGEDGLQGVPRRMFLGLIDTSSDLNLYYVVLLICGGGIAFAYRVVHSPFGMVLNAVRDNEPRAISLGYDADRYKLLAFVMSATLAGLAGSTKVLVFQLASMTDVQWMMSGEVVLMTLVGGLGTVLGPAVGAAIVVSMHNYFSGFGEWVVVIQGVIFVLVVSLFRRGIVGEILAWAENHRARRRGK